MEHLAALGITRGCASDAAHFCPYQPVSRGQMASFLVRAFRLSAEGSDSFADIGVSTHLADIGTLAASGVTKGCATNPARYCPLRNTTQAEMATFIVRALQLSPISDAGFVALTAGWDYSCGLRGNGAITCWGADSYGQAEAPAGRFVAVSARYYHSCGVRANHTVVCWGQNEYGQADPPPGAFTSLAARRGPHMWPWRRRSHHLLGTEPLRTGQPAQEPVPGGGHRWGPLVRHPKRPNHYLLGTEQIRASGPTAGNVHSCSCRVETLLRTKNRPNHYLLGPRAVHTSPQRR